MAGKLPSLDMAMMHEIGLTPHEPTQIEPVVKPKRRRGRPHLYGDRGQNVTVYLTPQEKRLLELLGNKCGAGPSGAIRFLIKFYAQHRGSEE